MPLIDVTTTHDGVRMLRVPDAGALVDDERYSAFVYELLMNATPAQVETRFRHQDHFNALASRTGDVHPGDVACAEAYCVTTVRADDEDALRRFTAAMFGEPDARTIPSVAFALIPVPRPYGVEARVLFPTAEDLRAYQITGDSAVLPVGHGPVRIHGSSPD